MEENKKLKYFKEYMKTGKIKDAPIFFTTRYKKSNTVSVPSKSINTSNPNTPAGLVLTKMNTAFN